MKLYNPKLYSATMFLLKQQSSLLNLHEETEGNQQLLWIPGDILHQMDEYSSPGNRVAQPSSNGFFSLGPWKRMIQF
jgi:hypothetical protein